MRFIAIPPSTNASFTIMSSGSIRPASSLFCKFDTAERSTFSAIFAACFGEKCRICSARPPICRG